MKCELAFKGKIFIDGRVVEGTALSVNGFTVLRGPSYVPTCEVLKGDYLIPAAVDIHVHLRGLMTSYKEEVKRATMAAAKGGVALVFDMPNTVPPIKDLKTYEMKKEELKESLIDYALYSLPSKELRNYVIGFKLYPNELSNIENIIDIINGKFTVMHAEVPWGIREGFPRHAMRHKWLEIEAIRLYGKYVDHVTHVTTKEGCEEAFRLGKTCDVTPHHLLLSQPDDCISKVNPPLREERDRKELLRFFLNNDVIYATDHAPHAPFEKSLHYPFCPSGISSIEFSLLLLLEIGERYLNNPFALLDRYTCLPAIRVGLFPLYGSLRGFASWVILAKNRRKIRDYEVISNPRSTPFEGFEVGFEVIATTVRGQIAYREGEFFNSKGVDVTSMREVR